MSDQTKVLIVDDSAIVRRVMVDRLSRQHGIEVVGTAPDPYAARERIIALEPDVITLDIEMPKMDGLTFLKKLMKFHPVPTIVLSSIAQHGTEMAINCLEAGAIEVVAKPDGSHSVGEVSNKIADIIRGVKDVQLECASKRVSPAPIDSGESVDLSKSKPSSRIIAIGASTGGTEALKTVLTQLPCDIPGIVIVQHMPAGFTNAFARRLNDLSKIHIAEAQDGDKILDGTALIAPGDRQMKVVKDGRGWKVHVFDGPRVCRHRPSVEVLFDSVADNVATRAMGVIMTGMGADGAQAMCHMKDKGAYTVSQNKESCVVYGMPREADERGAVCKSLHLSDIANEIVQHSHAKSAA